ncbi:MAG: FAD-dependent oxidoreductase [Candidatus Azobacteroides sp.]|nr:FAD-dependent oxidoreductase [Candidatus Azobacteroides sp.]
MKKLHFLFFFPFLFFSLFSCSENNDYEEVDICIYGGTSAGVIAAYTAVNEGKSVILIEPGINLGGMSSGGLGYTDIGNKYVVKGLARDFYRKLGTHYGKLEQWIFEPSVAESIFNEYIQKANVNVLYHTRLHDVKKEGTQLKEIIVENSLHPDISTNKRIKAKMFIDCSYEGDLLGKSGASYTVGREDNNVYNETYNGVQLLEGHQFWHDIDPYIIPGDSTSGLLWGISNNKLAPRGTGDKKVQAYNFRICLTDTPENMIPITEPDNYDPKKYELLIRLQEVSPRKSVYDFFIWSRMPNSKTDINNAGGFSTDVIGMNWDYPEADYEERERIRKEHEDYTKGLLYFLGHDERVPESMRNEMRKWGYPKDEYVNNNHWTHQLYVREARRMVGELVMTQHHCEGKEVVEDVIGWAAYTMDSHNCDRIVVNGFVKNEGNVEIGGFPPYSISYRAIIPKKEEVTNLLVPVCLSASHIAYGSIRMEPVFMVLAQAAAVAASQAIEKNITIQEVNVTELKKVLEENPLADGSTAEILIDNDDKENVIITGEWKYNYDTYSSYAANFLMDESAGKEAKSVKYIPEIKTAGNYSVFVYFPKLPNGASVTTLALFDGKTEKEIKISRDDILVEGQTMGEWVKAGDLHLEEGKNAYVEITNKDADNVIVADAVLFLPIK